LLVCNFLYFMAQFHTARELGDTLLRLPQCALDPALAVLAHYALENTWLCLGALPAAHQHLEAGSACYTSDQRPPGYTGRYWSIGS
jgi:hypothetical protein